MKSLSVLKVIDFALSHPARGAWIEISGVTTSVTASLSHPARGAWIEIESKVDIRNCHAVAPREGCVD